MYVKSLSFVVLILQLLPPVASSPALMTREEGEEVVFMFNKYANTRILEVTWGISDGNTSNFRLVLIVVRNVTGVQSITSTSKASYARRVSFVGDLTKGQAWFKITNLNINDTNQYMAQIRAHGSSNYEDIPAQLTVIKTPVTTEPLKTSTRELTTGVSSSQTSLWPTTSQVPQFSNRSMSINVVKEVVGDFSDPNSAAFKQFSKNFVSEINSVYKNIHIFEKAKVTGLSETIICVKFVVYFKSTRKGDEICGPLKDAVKDNRLGSLKIVPGSLGCSNDPSTSVPKKPSNSASTCTSIIVACVTVNIFLILVVVFLVIYIWRVRLNNEKRAGRRNSSSIQDKNPEAYENIHPMEDTSQDMATKTAQTPNTEKELYEMINENRDKNNVAITTTVKHASGSSVAIQDNTPSLPQHYQELQRKAPNPTPLYEPLKQQGFGNKEELASEDPKTYEQLQQSASGREYQSLKRYKDTESKV